MVADGFRERYETMADDMHAEAHQPGAMDIQGHVSTYSKVIGMLKWGAVACFVLAFVVIWLIYT
jgi:type VI protein secretion system component VasF